MTFTNVIIFVNRENICNLYNCNRKIFVNDM